MLAKSSKTAASAGSDLPPWHATSCKAILCQGQASASTEQLREHTNNRNIFSKHNLQAYFSRVLTANSLHALHSKLEGFQQQSILVTMARSAFRSICYSNNRNIASYRLSYVPRLKTPESRPIMENIRGRKLGKLARQASLAVQQKAILKSLCRCKAGFHEDPLLELIMPRTFAAPAAAIAAAGLFIPEDTAAVSS